MSVLSPLSIATDGYVCRQALTGGQRCPEPIAIATGGYVCADRIVRISILDGDGGTGIGRQEAQLILDLAPIIILAVEECEADE